MHVELRKPELARYIDQQVRAGHFASPEAAVEAAVTQMMLEHGELDEKTLAAIAQADAGYEAGEFVQWRDVRDDLRRKYTGK